MRDRRARNRISTLETRDRIHNHALALERLRLQALEREVAQLKEQAALPQGIPSGIRSGITVRFE